MTGMFQDKYVFAQLTAFLNRTQFNNYVRKYDGNRYVKHFTCWNQLLAMMFGQLSNRESLRDLIVAFEAHRAKQYHLGLGRKPISKTTFASANQNRDYRIFEVYDGASQKETYDGYLQVERQCICFRLNDHSFVFVGLLVGKVP